MTVLRMRWQQGGGHVHVRVFAGPDNDHLAKCGDLAFRTEEWRDLHVRLQGTGVQIMPEEVHDVVQ